MIFVPLSISPIFNYHSSDLLLFLLLGLFNYDYFDLKQTK